MEIRKQSNKMSLVYVGSAMIWAAIILISSYVLRGTEESQIIFYTLIFAASLQISLLDFLFKKKKNFWC